MITPLKQNKNPFVTPGTEKPDLSNGPYLSFNGDNGAITYIQMTNGKMTHMQSDSQMSWTIQP